MSSDLLTTEGTVRGVYVAETAQSVPYARIRLARDPGYFMDFDDADSWPELRGQPVRITWSESVGSDGYSYRVVLDVEVLS